MAKKTVTKKVQTPEDPTITAYYEAFQARLRFLRERKGLSQPAFAKALGCPPANYKKYEKRSKSKFPPHLLEQLSRLTDSSLEFIVLGTGDTSNIRQFRRQRATDSDMHPRIGSARG
jgi:transcriptional regulator with XRE-family HTH domain